MVQYTIPFHAPSSVYYYIERQANLSRMAWLFAPFTASFMLTPDRLPKKDAVSHSFFFLGSLSSSLIGFPKYRLKPEGYGG